MREHNESTPPGAPTTPGLMLMTKKGATSKAEPAGAGRGKVLWLFALVFLTGLSTMHNARRISDSLSISDDDDDDDDDFAPAAAAFARKNAKGRPTVSNGTPERKAVFSNSTPGLPERADDPQERSAPSDGWLPIHVVLNATSRTTARTTWGEVAARWTRTAQFEDLLGEDSTATSNGPPPALAAGMRKIVMIHCGPKTGSTTLRKACRNHLRKTCGEDVGPSHGHKPPGYMDEGKLYPLMRRCANTTHFCAKEVTMPSSSSEVPAFDDVEFVHLFPFRNYDEWARSALKQQYDRGREAGCAKAEELFAACQPSRMEIDLRKYAKAQLSRFKGGVADRVRSLGERHTFLLYRHRDLDDVMGMLGGAYGVPSLPGSDGRGKERRPEGTCDGRVLERFHDCFSWELTRLA